MLEQINSPQDLKKLNEKEKKQLAEEIRKYILDVVSENGGHLASNLGVVELTIALHSVFNVPEDKIVWDVGHQSYVHKIITGRREELKNIRKLNGIAGFPKSNESDADCFNTGHSSTSISAVLGMARARDLQEKKNSCIAVIGDGALTGGMALEALNDAGCSNCNLTVILNDNEMSIAKNIGGINQFLSTLRTKKLYTRTNKLIKNKLNKLPVVGNKLVRIIQRFKRACKQLVIRGMYFEDIGFTYLGPVDGHNIEKLESILKLSKEIEGPVLIHVLTKKGKGYKIAEKNPDRFHATSPFNIETGELKKEKKSDYSKIFGEKLVKLARENEKIVAVTASMKDGTGLREFQKEFPKRFFDVGIAEQHAITMSAGMAKEGMIPVIPIYSSFYQRAYDQVIHDVAMQNLPVIMCVDRAGCVGADGETHQGLLDMAFFRLVPNLTIMAPKDFKELEDMLEYAIELKKPVVIRYPRGGEDKEIQFDKHEKIEEGKVEIVKQYREVMQIPNDEGDNNSNKITIISIGKMVARAMKMAEKLEKEDTQNNVQVINVRFLKPLDREAIIKVLQDSNKVITMEDGTIINGLATAIKEVMVEENVRDVKIETYAYPDMFIPHGSVDELERDKWGRFLNVPKGHLRTVHICPFSKTERRIC